MSLSIDISKRYKDFSLQVKLETDGRRLGLLGASGCGKSMTLKCIAGIEKPDRGSIQVNGRALFDSEKKINLIPQRRKVGYLFQNYALFPNMTVAQNIGCGLKGDRKEKLPVIRNMVEMLHLEGLENRYPSQLSGGQQQRVALARILAYEPDVLMLDEPFSALDAFLKESLLEELLETLKLYKGDIIIVSHNRDEIYSLCESLAIIDNGSLVRRGDTGKVFKDPQKLAAARLTGCKNISPVRKIDEYKLEALDWELVLHTKDRITEDIRYIGIRAHDVKPVSEAGENSFPLKNYRVVENPFEKNILCKCGPGEIWWKLGTKDWNVYQEGEGKGWLCLPEESLLLLS